MRSRVETETQLKNKVLKYLKTLPNIWIYKTADKFTTGIPDVLVCFKGHFIAFELKRKGKKPTKIQDFVLGEIVKAGGSAYPITNLDSVKCIMERLKITI